MIHILVTIDSNYIPPFKTMLFSLFLSNPGKRFCIHLVYSDIGDEDIKSLQAYTASFSQQLRPIPVSDDFFHGAPITKHYTKAMYYRLLAHELLPRDIDKVLYLDPDILVVNPIDALYDTDLSQHLFAACSHNGVVIDGINKVRLQNVEAEAYYNSGVLLMNLERHRHEIRLDELLAYIKDNEALLILPDQDVLNGLYGVRILSLDDSLYNYDVRKYNYYHLASAGEKDMDWILRNTVILHYCGKQKPWKVKYGNRFIMLHKHYQQLVLLHEGGGNLDRH